MDLLINQRKNHFNEEQQKRFPPVNSECNFNKTHNTSRIPNRK